MKNKIILVGGYCATGKSTFSRRLSELLNIPCFNKDVIKEVMGDGFGSENDMVEKKGSAATFLLMLHIAECFLKVGQTCILESNFKKLEMEQLKKLLERYNCECLTYILKGDFNVLYNRYMERDVIEKRHWVHNTAGETKENFQEGHLYHGIGEDGIGQTVFTDATLFENVNYNELYTVAREFIGK